MAPDSALHNASQSASHNTSQSASHNAYSVLSFPLLLLLTGRLTIPGRPEKANQILNLELKLGRLGKS